ncbi:MAG: TSUP family transporter [Acidimicrobiia bacterium]
MEESQQMSILVWLAAFVITVGAASVQGAAGVGFAMVSIPLLTLIDPRLTPIPQLIIVLPMTISMAWRERKGMDLHGIGWIIVGRFPGLLLGVALLAVATQIVLDTFIAIVVLLAVAAIGTGYKVHRTSLTKFLAGVAAGITGIVASIGGPPVALIYSDEEARTIRPTLAAIFTIGVSLSLLGRVAIGDVGRADLIVSAVLLPAVLIGYAIARRYQDKLPPGAAKVTILIVSAVASVALLLRAWVL